MITYRLSDVGIFYVKFSGKVDLKDINAYLTNLKKITLLPPDILILYDMLETEILITIDDLKTISEDAEIAISQFHSVKAAFVVNQPVLTAMSIIFSESPYAGRSLRRTFSTIESAVKWLLEST